MFVFRVMSKLHHVVSKPANNRNFAYQLNSYSFEEFVRNIQEN